MCTKNKTPLRVKILVEKAKHLILKAIIKVDDNISAKDDVELSVNKVAILHQIVLAEEGYLGVLLFNGDGIL
jgi:hypothetical protein